MTIDKTKISLFIKERGHTIFVYDKVKVFFKHTDYCGLVHPYNYLEWMSYAREEFFNRAVPQFALDLNDPIRMITVAMEYHCLAEAKFGDELEIIIYTQKVRRISFDVIFEFYIKLSRKFIGTGKQTIAFVYGEHAKPAAIPEALYSEIKLGEKSGI